MTNIEPFAQTGGGITLSVLRFKENQGHGKARKRGLESCKNEIVALMDADDICASDRFKQQIHFFTDDGIDIVGGDIAEFTNAEEIIAFRRVPIKDAEIKTYMKKRCPFNQMTVMFRKSSVMGAGGYLDWYCDEDYYLWIRMALNECVMANTGTVLCYVRVGKDMYRRRGGLKYFQSETSLQKYMLKNGMIRFPRYVINVLERLVLQVFMPNGLRMIIFQKLARSR